MHGQGGDYKDLVVFLAAAGVIVPLVNRLKISPILGFLAAGVLLGPDGLGRFAQSVPWLSWLTIGDPGQLAQLSEKWQGEVEAIQQEAQNMYKTYQSDLVFLSAEMKTKREEAIVKKEQEAQELKRKYFGAEGELYKKRESLMKPMQDEIYNAVKLISEEKGYQVVVDRASAMSIIFASPKIDISNEVLLKLGYSK